MKNLQNQMFFLVRNEHKRITPYYSDPEKFVYMYNEDCIESLNSMPDSFIDMIFADPPYFLSNDGITCYAGQMVSVNKGEWDRSKGFRDSFKFTERWLSACRRVLKENGTIWVSGTYHIIHLVGVAMELDERVIEVPVPMPAWMLGYLTDLIPESEGVEEDQLASLYGQLLSNEAQSLITFEGLEQLLEWHYGQNFRSALRVMLNEIRPARS